MEGNMNKPGYLIILFVSVILAACAAGSKVPPTPISTGLPSKTEGSIKPLPATNAFPSGIFVQKNHANWKLQFNADGSYVFLVNDQVDATGTYSIRDNLYTEETEFAPCKDACTASYTWEFDGKNLTFHLVGEDLCKDRRESLDGIPWIMLDPAPS